MLFFTTLSYSQIGFGFKAGVDLSFYDVKDNPPLSPPITPAFTLFGEYKSDNIAGELEFTYTNPAENGFVEEQGIISSASFKLYCVEEFAIKIGGYLNSSKSYYWINEDKYEIEMKDVGLAFAMEAYIWKGLFVDGRLLFDLNDKEGISSQHIIFSTGYKF